MARNFTLSTLVTRAQQRCDQENSSLISTSEWKGIISSGYAKLHSILARSGLRYFETTQSLTATSTALPADFLSTVSVDFVVNATTGERRALAALMTPERNMLRWTGAAEAVAYALEGANIVLYPAISAGTYIHTYIPQPTDYSSSADGTTIDVVCPEAEEFLIWYAALRARDKEESDTTSAERNLMVAQDQLEEWATHRLLEEPRRRIVSPLDMAYPYDPGDWWR